MKRGSPALTRGLLLGALLSAAACGAQTNERPVTPQADAAVDQPDSTAADARADAFDAGADASDASLPSRFDLNDVSFLYPLPTWEKRDDLLQMSAAGARGPLLTTDRFAQLPAEVQTAMPFDRLRVVSARVDRVFRRARRR